MTNFAIVKPDGTINHVVDSSAQAEFDATALGMRVAQISDDVSVNDALLLGVFAGQVLTLKERVAVLIDEFFAFRTKRNYLLASSDWTQLPDIAKAIQMAWQPYRQALRDLPLEEDPLKANWPSPP